MMQNFPLAILLLPHHRKPRIDFVLLSIPGELKTIHTAVNVAVICDGHYLFFHHRNDRKKGFEKCEVFLNTLRINNHIRKHRRRERCIICIQGSDLMRVACEEGGLPEGEVGDGGHGVVKLLASSFQHLGDSSD